MDRQPYYPGNQYPTNQYPQPGPFLPPPPPGPMARPPRRRRIWLVLTIVAVLVAAGVAVPLVLFHHPRALTAPSPGAAPGPSTTAPAAPPGVLLKLGPGPASAGPVRWGTAPMYDACSVLPMNTVLTQGIALDPAYAVFDDNPASGNTGGIGVNQPNTVTRGSSSCYYPGSDTEAVGLTLYQQPFSTADDITQEIQVDQSGGTASTVNGYTVYTEQREATEWDISITNNQVLAELNLTLKHGDYHGHTPAMVVASLTNTVVAGLRNPPGPASQIHYSAPYTDINPCSIFTANDFATYLGVPDDQHPHTELQLGERELAPAAGGTQGLDSHYITTQCQRFSVALDQGTSDAPGIVAVFDTYRTVEQAQFAIKASCVPNPVDDPLGPPTAAGITINGDLACYPVAGRPGDKPLYFRGGRTVASVWLWEDVDPTKLAQLTQLLQPLAQDLSTKLAAL